MILIADAGATKTDWAIAGNSEIFHFSTQGINPYIQDEYKIEEIIKNELMPVSMKYAVDMIFYYGAGCGNQENRNIIRSVLLKVFPQVEIMVDTDLMAAARAVFLQSDGIICILGTGSNSGIYNGLEIVTSIPALGYVLGDEGSAAFIGKTFLRDLFYGYCPLKIATHFYEKFCTDKDSIIKQVYHGANVNVFLGSIARYIQFHSENEYVKSLLYYSFKEYFIHHIITYSDYKSYNLGFSGSLAYANKDLIKLIANEYHLKIVNVIKNPIENLINFHLNLTGDKNENECI